MRTILLATLLVVLAACGEDTLAEHGAGQAADLSGCWTTATDGRTLRTFHIGSDRLHDIIYEPIYRIRQADGTDRYQVHTRSLGLTRSENGPWIAIIDGGLEVWRIEVIDDQTIRIGEHRFTRCAEPPDLSAALAPQAGP